MLGQWVVVNSTGDIEVLLEPVPPRDYALLALVSTFAGKVERIVDWRRDMTHLDEQVEENRHGVATTRKDARQYVPLLAGTIRDLRYRNDIGDFGYRDGRNHTYDAPSPVGGLVFDGRAMWAPTADKNGAPRLMRIERYATENDPDAFIPVDRSLKSGAFDGGRVWYTAQNIGDDGMGSLLAIDVETHTIHSLLVPGRPQAIMFDGHFLWVTTDAATIHQIDVDRNQIVRTLALPVIPGVPTLQPLALEFDGEDIWVSATLRTLFRIQKPWGDPESVSVHQSTQDFIKLAYDGSHLWTLSLNGRLGKLDVLSHASRFLALPTNELVTGELLFDGAYVWAMVTDSELNPAMYRYDPRIDQISDSVPLPRTVDPGWRAPWPTTLNSLRLHAFDGTHLWYPFYAGVIDGERKYGVQKFLVA